MPDETKLQRETLSFDYIKSSLFRAIHADGAFFALSQNGLTICFFLNDNQFRAVSFTK